jgi:hypothetical protein
LRIFTFVELPAFERHREAYLDDCDYQAMQAFLLEQPDAGAVLRVACRR